MDKTIRIKYHSDKIDRLTYVDGKSDWIDLRSAEDVTLKAGQFYLINLGVSVQLPEGYEMITAARSSTFRNYGLIQSNGIGVVDESYCGDGDVLKMPVYATRDTVIEKNDRIAQFRVMENQPHIEFVEDDLAGNVTRGGFGSTGRK